MAAGGRPFPDALLPDILRNSLTDTSPTDRGEKFLAYIPSWLKHSNVGDGVISTYMNNISIMNFMNSVP